MKLGGEGTLILWGSTRHLQLADSGCLLIKSIHFTAEIYLFIKTVWFLKLSGQASNPLRLSTQRSLTVLNSREKMNSFAFLSSWKRVLIYKSTQGKTFQKPLYVFLLEILQAYGGEVSKPEDQNRALKQNISMLTLVSVRRICGACLTVSPK